MGRRVVLRGADLHSKPNDGVAVRSGTLPAQVKVRQRVAVNRHLGGLVRWRRWRGRHQQQTQVRVTACALRHPAAVVRAE